MQRAREPAVEPAMEQAIKQVVKPAMEQTILQAISQSKFGFAHSNHILVISINGYDLIVKGIFFTYINYNIARMVLRI